MQEAAGKCACRKPRKHTWPPRTNNFFPIIIKETLRTYLVHKRGIYLFLRCFLTSLPSSTSSSPYLAVSTSAITQFWTLGFVYSSARWQVSNLAKICKVSSKIELQFRASNQRRQFTLSVSDRLLFSNHFVSLAMHELLQSTHTESCFWQSTGHFAPGSAETNLLFYFVQIEHTKMLKTSFCIYLLQEIHWKPYASAAFCSQRVTTGSKVKLD